LVKFNFYSHDATMHSSIFTLIPQLHASIVDGMTELTTNLN